MSNTYIKKFSELPVKPTTTGGEKVIINDDGVAKQVPINTLHVVKDFNQNNPDAPDYIKNRPVYVEEGVDFEIIHATESTNWTAEAVLDKAEEGSIFTYDCAYGIIIKAMPIELYVGQTAYCVFDGVEYECVSYEITDPYGRSSTVIGSNRAKDAAYSATVVDTPDNIPFAVSLATEDTATLISVIYYDTLSLEHDLSVMIKKSNVHTLDPKYLPKGYPYWEEREIELANETKEFLAYDDLSTPVYEIVTSNNYYDYYSGGVEINYTSFGGDVVTVVWDGTTYKYDDSNMVMIDENFCVGNGAVINAVNNFNFADTGEQFLIMIQNDRVYLYSNVEGEHSYAIYGHAKIPHKMDENFVEVDLWNYLTKNEAYDRYMTQWEADSRYVTESYVNDNYVHASTFNPSNYVTTSNANNVYIRKTDAANTYLTQATADNRYLREIPEDTSYETKAHAAAIYVPYSELKGADWDSTDRTSLAYIDNKPSIQIKETVQGALYALMEHNQIGFYDPKPFGGFKLSDEPISDMWIDGTFEYSNDRQLAVCIDYGYTPLSLWTLNVSNGALTKYDIDFLKDSKDTRVFCVENTRSRIYIALGTTVYVLSAIDGSTIKNVDLELQYGICDMEVSPDGTRLVVTEKTDYRTFAYSVVGESFTLMGELGTRNPDDIAAAVSVYGSVYAGNLLPAAKFNSDGTRLYVYGILVPGSLQVFNISGGAIMQVAQYTNAKKEDSSYPLIHVALDNTKPIAYIFDGSLRNVKIYDMSNNTFDLLHDYSVNENASSPGILYPIYHTIVDGDMFYLDDDIFSIKGGYMEYLGRRLENRTRSTFFVTGSDSGYCYHNTRIYRIQKVHGVIYPDSQHIQNIDKYYIGKVFHKTSMSPGDVVTFKIFWEIDKTERDHFVLKADNSDKKFKVMVNDAGEIITSEIVDV